MLSIIAVPKAFDGHIGVIQRNAIQSWIKLKFDKEIILYGSDPGVEDVAKEFNLKHIPDIDVNQFGTPMLDSVFHLAKDNAKHDKLCFVNADIILLSDFSKAIKSIRSKRNFIVGRRTNIDIDTEIDFLCPHWQTTLSLEIKKYGELFGASALDYFVFSKHDKLMTLPAFTIGRPAWDNWFLSHARSLGLKIVDATYSICCVHQNHDYSHVSEARGNIWEGPEGDSNREIAGEMAESGTVYDASGVLWKGFVFPALGCHYVERRWLKWQEKFH